MNSILRHSAAPAVTYLFASQLYDTFIKHQRQQPYHSSKIEHSTTCSTHNYYSTTNCTTNLVHVTQCDADPNVNKNIFIQEAKHTHPKIVIESKEDDKHIEIKAAPLEKEHAVENKDDEEEGPFFHNLFPIRQLWKPNLEYPLWDPDWDGRKMEVEGIDKDKEKEMMRYIRKNGVTRHIILIRHGQYDETHKVCLVSES